MANAHRRRNSLVRIKINGNRVFEETEIKAGEVQAFQSLLAENGDWRPSCMELTFDVLGGDEAALLEVPFSKVEVFKALSNLNGDKASKADGFSFAF